MRMAGRLVAGLVVASGTVAAVPAAAAPCQELPVMMIVQDRSNSMWGYPNSSCMSDAECDRKWGIAGSVVPDVANQFAGGFRYSLMMFPGDKSDACSMNTALKLDIGASPNDISLSFTDSVNSPYGATPTAAALRAAKDRLLAANLPPNAGSAHPAYVLLVTDGIPNCNPSLDVDSATCTCTVSRTGTPLTCPSGRCLDGAETAAAAAELRAAGFPVYVVGFGGEVTADNNVAVLNSVAQSGGTSQAYLANDSASLHSALQAVITLANDCCQDACTQGDTQCAPSGTARTVCQMGGEGCTVWTTQQCGSGNICNATTEQCESCTTTCTAGATECLNDGTARTCVADARGCTSWQNTACAFGQTCSGGSCSSCTGTCTPGARQCSGNGSQVCVADARGCTSWSTVTPCAAGSTCNDSTGQCSACNTACVAGSRDCASATEARVCVADANGCTSWQSSTCQNGTMCGGGECASCNACTEGETRCAGNLPQSCVADGLGCTRWESGTACGVNQVCANGGCLECSNGCEAGDIRCNGNTVETCVTAVGTCNRYELSQTCEANEQCSSGACCSNACTGGERRCVGSTQVQECATSITGCQTWQAPLDCAAGEACRDGDCILTCELTGEGETNCPDGYICEFTEDGNFCVPGSSGGSSSSGGTSSSSGGHMAPRGDAGLVDSVGGGGEEEEELAAQSCGCTTSEQGTEPAALLVVLMALVAVRRRRR